MVWEQKIKYFTFDCIKRKNNILKQKVGGWKKDKLYKDECGFSILLKRFHG